MLLNLNEYTTTRLSEFGTSSAIEGCGCVLCCSNMSFHLASEFGPHSEENNNQSVFPLITYETRTVESDGVAPEYSAGDASFDFSVNTNSSYVGKKITVTLNSITDVDGTSSASPTITWYKHDPNTAFTLDNLQQIASGTFENSKKSEFTITANEIDFKLLYKLEFVDDAGNDEATNFTYATAEAVFEPSESLNTERSEVDFDEYVQYLAGLSEPVTEQLVQYILTNPVYKWGAELGTAPSLTYTIIDPGPMTYGDMYKNEGTYHPGFFEALETQSATNSDLQALEFLSEEKGVILDSLNDWSMISGIQFNEVAYDVDAPADLVFTKLDFDLWSQAHATVSSGSAGFAWLPYTGSDFLPGDIFIDNDFGNEFQTVVSHEIGHALGLAHPHGGHVVQGDGSGSDLSTWSDDIANFWTIMSYDNQYQYQSVTPMAIDLLAMNTIYGGMEAHGGNTTHTYLVDDFTGAKNWNIREMLHDTDGAQDSLIIQNNGANGVFINLNPGSYSSLKSMQVIEGEPNNLIGTNPSIYEFGNLYISEATQIEGLSTTNGADTVNAIVNWQTEIDLRAGDDVLYAGGHESVYNGATGVDNLVISDTDFSNYYVNTIALQDGYTPIYSDANELYCVVQNFEFVTLLNTVTSAEQQIGWDVFVEQYTPPVIIEPPAHTYIDFTDGADGIPDNTDDTFALVRSSADAAKDFKTADLVLVKTVGTTANGVTTYSTSYHKLVSDIFASADVSTDPASTAVGTLLENADYHDFLLVEDDTSNDPADWKVVVGHDHSKEVTGLRFDDGGDADPANDTLNLDIATLDTDGYVTADLVVRVNYEQGPSKYALVKEAAFDGVNKLNYSDIQSSLITALEDLEHQNPDPSTMDIDFVLVADASTMVDSTGAGLDILVQEFGVTETPPAGELYDVYDLVAGDFGIAANGTYALLFEGPDETGKFNLLLQEVARDTSTAPYKPVGEPVFPTVATSDTYGMGPVGNPDGLYQIHSLAAGEFGQTDAGSYVIWPGVEGNGVHMFKVGQDGTNWSNIGPATPPTPVGAVFILDPVDNGGGPDTGGDESPFELVEVAGERYGDIITFGIQLKDNEDGTVDSLDLASASFQIDWEEGEYEFWGGFENEAPTPDNDSDTADDLKTLGLTLNNAGGNATRINLETFIGSTPVTYDEGDLVATFMLERTDQSGAIENFIDLTKSNYTTADAPLDDILTAAQTFRYDYDKDTINIDMVTASGEEVPDATLYVSSDTVTDGLSVVAVEQMGRLVKYQLVLNVSVPMTMDALATIDTSQSVDIYGAHIFTDSLIDITSFEAGGDGEGAVSAAVITATDGNDASVTVGDAADGYSGTEFFDQVDAAMELLDDTDGVDTSLLAAIDVTDHLHIDVTALGDLQGDGLDGRYVLAEFVAYTDGSISFSDNWNVDDGITINQIEVNGADANTQNFEVSDGSDVVLLGESVYLNPGLNIDAISATDALGALKIANDDTGYSQSQIIAADFDASGDVSAMDAYNILHYAVFGEGSGDEIPTWVYIDDIDSGTAAAEAVTYDNNIDLFIGDLTDIDATGVLRGDVSQNYTEIPDGYNTLDYYLGAFTAAMGDLTDGTDLATAPTYV